MTFENQSVGQPAALFEHIMAKWSWQKPMRLVTTRTSGSIMAAPVMYSVTRCSSVSRIRQMGSPPRLEDLAMGMVQIFLSRVKFLPFFPCVP